MRQEKKSFSAGVSNYLSYKEAGNTDIPQIVLMIDNLTALNELYLQDDDTLLTICREGIAVGISVIVANSQTQGIGYRYISNFASKVALFCNDSGEYSSIFDYCRMQIPSVAGRCIIEKDKQHYECQTYLAFEGEKEHERVDEMRKFVKGENEKNNGLKAKRIPQIPNNFDMKYIENMYGNQKNNEFICGISYSTILPIKIDILENHLFGICGPKQKRIEFVGYMLEVLRKKQNKHIVFLINQLLKTRSIQI